ncbi:alpha/beta hydrolase [Nostoc sp. ChiQUE01b]|uniref:alpha/beta hydrolase n=1 Tax=Nostoc sp. ChiQUE01b TaxID=3075376 RepID=UPI002AD43A06|nr:alpha/beta hydrolase [Nostoc sp. ChiQUE01b]MDZ8262755.1 alpha/beta hydrolase [Nostoc sp. ChiQUE01b]
MSINKTLVFQNKRNQNLVGVLEHDQVNEPRPCLIVCHGFGGTKDGLNKRFVKFAHYAVKHNFSVFRFDFAGSGDSDGDFGDQTLDTQLEDLEAAIDFVATIDGIDPNTIGLVGHCLGATTVIRESARNAKIYKTVAWAPVIDLSGTTRRLIGKNSFFLLDTGHELEIIPYRELIKQAPKFTKGFFEPDMLKEIEQVNQPLLIIHGTKDAAIPLQEVEQLVEQVKMTSKKPIKLQIIEGGQHSFPFHQQETFELTIEWFIN